MNETKKNEIQGVIKNIAEYNEKVDIIKRDIAKIKIYLENDKFQNSLDESIETTEDRLLLSLHSMTEIKWVLTQYINKSQK